ncbi:MAG: hypothetical protein GX061_04220 [Eubacteriaceae bacterium]|nr:hypothetical protein [Eubacteriaceae bacterium]
MDDFYLIGIYAVVVIAPILIGLIEIIIKLRKRSFMKNKYNLLIQKYNLDSVLLVKCRSSSNESIACLHDCYIGLNDQAFFIIASDPNPYTVRIQIKNLAYFTLVFRWAEDRKMDYSKDGADFWVYYYSDDEQRAENKPREDIYFESGDSGHADFNKYALKKNHFFNNLRRYVHEKTTDITI